MKNQNFGIALIALALTSANASISENQEKMDQTYKNYYSNAALNCEYKYFIDVPRIKTLNQENIIGESVSAEYQIKSRKLNIEVIAGGQNGQVDFQIDNTSFSASLIESKYGKINNHITIDLNSLNSSQKKIANELSLSNLDCSLDIGQDNHFKVTENKLHINMHPHQVYDWDGESNPGILEQFKNPGQHLMLFDDDIKNKNIVLSSNYNAYIQGTKPDIAPHGFTPPTFEIPNFSSLGGSQAGHSKYILTKAKHEITFTGGNHNYCIMNGTRRVIHGFMENENSESITIKYPTSAIVIQMDSWWKKAGLIKNVNVPSKYAKNSNMLSNVFEQMKRNKNGKALRKYLNAYFNYFSFSYANEKIYYFKTLTINQTGISGFEMSKTIQGKGEGHLEINFVYE